MIYYICIVKTWPVAWEQILINNKPKKLKENINKYHNSHCMLRRSVVITTRMAHNHIWYT